MKTYTIYLIEVKGVNDRRYHPNPVLGYFFTPEDASDAVSRLPTNNPRCRIRTAQVLSQ